MIKLAKKFVLVFAALALLAVAPMLVFDRLAGDSRCYGSTGAGAIEGASRMPLWGPNYRTYCVVCALALRTYGHEQVVASLDAAFEQVAETARDTLFVYGEIGFPWGGPFPPHRTHRNGLSIDVMSPLKHGRVIRTSALNRFGYDEEFDANGVGASGEIDFDALAALIDALHTEAKARGGRIARVILAPDLQDNLFATRIGARLRGAVAFNQRQAWVRHDDHIHVDFLFPCAS